MIATKNNRGQQEMVGFVLIVVIMVIALFVFLVISLGQKDVQMAGEGRQNLADNMLSSVISTTTGCAPVNEPNYDSVKDLFVSSFKGRRCNNLDIMADEYLNSTLTDILGVAVSTEAVIGAYELTYQVKGESEPRLIMRGGVPLGVMYASHLVTIISGSDSLVLSLTIWSES